MGEISKQFNFQEREEKIYALWEKSGFFQPENIKSSKKYCNVLPPPNANGELHIGHASGYTVMDIFGRFERMQGKKVLLLPGKDHAGIQTQVVFEKKLKDEKGISRRDLGREKFYQECFDFTMKSSDYMRSQEKRIGISADWSREKFTLDPDVLQTALETFVKMHKDGLVYKGRRIVNWCSRCATALSDIEVIHKETDGKLYYIKYPIKDSKEFITVATTRPETMLGDTAVAVNPKDRKYLSIIGKTVILPLQEKEIPVIADRRVEMEFGTGAVKITPAHDPLDWQIGKDHKLSEIQVIDEKAQITAEGGRYQGQKVMDARENILHDLKQLNLLEKEEEIKINKSICERCKTTIEPILSEQWFVSVDGGKYSLKKEALKAIKAGKINFYPENFKKIMVQWLENLQDWCISRQIWWGPQFPVWYKDSEIYVGIVPPKGAGWIQDENTFDTWFTSGQWAYTTLGYPNSADYKKFYPTDTMIMGRDILFFWASRMIMLGIYRTGKIPFRNLYFTGLIRDKDGHKFSKSRGNGIDPLDMIKKFGADALRLSLVMDVSPGQDSRLYEEKIESFRNFVTKLWNISRYAAQSNENFALVEKISKRDLKSLSDQWIICELEETVEKVTDLIKNKNISMAQNIMREFTWDKLADWYVEVNKIEKNAKILGYVLDRVLKLWHPFTPFVTEEIYSQLNGGEKILIMEKWPKAEKKFFDKKSKKEFGDLQVAISKIRNMRSNYHINPGEIIEAFGKKVSQIEIIEKLGRIKINSAATAGKSIEVASGKTKLKLNIADLVDVKKELVTIEKEIVNLNGLIGRSEAMLKNPGFVKSAPQEVVIESQRRLLEYKEKLEIQENLKNGLKELE